VGFPVVNAGHRRWISFVLLGLSSACTHQGAEESHGGATQAQSTVTSPSAAAAATSTGLSCRLVVSPGGSNRYALSIAVDNGTASRVTLRYVAPLGFALKAWSDDEATPLRIPAQSTAVEPVTTTLAPGASTTLPTAATLSFGPGSREADRDEPHRWWLDHEPVRTRLLAQRAFESHPALTCPGQLVP